VLGGINRVGGRNGSRFKGIACSIPSVGKSGVRRGMRS